jgi:hypothetical protein
MSKKNEFTKNGVRPPMCAVSTKTLKRTTFSLPYVPSSEIEKGIPFPDKSKFPFFKMEVGDSFFVPFTSCGPKAKMHSIISSKACTDGKKLHMKFSVRGVEGGFRVWRMK